MKLRLLLVKNGEVLFEVPLSVKEWTRKRLEEELEDFENDFDRFSRLFDALSHKSRFRMMKRLFEDDALTLGFADFMKDLGLNPKIVWESTKKLRRGGLLEKSENGKYRCSEQGEAGFLMLSLALRRLLQVIEEIKEW